MNRLSWMHALCALGMASFAHAGSLGPVEDAHFGVSGFARLDHGGGVDRTDNGNAVVLQSGRLLVAGGASVSGDSTYPTYQLPALARFGGNGAPDAGFGNDGWVLAPTPGANGTLVDVALTGDGKIVGFGTYSTSPASGGHAMLTRLSANGTPDTSFGPNALRLFALGASDTPTRMALQADGKLVALINFGTTGNSECIGVVRVNTDGTTDTAFRSGGNECLTSDNPTIPVAIGEAIAIQADGRIVIAGYANHLSVSNGDMLVVRLLANGQPDPAFGTGGFTWIAYDQGGSLLDMADAVAIDSAGRIVVAGSFENIYSTDMAIVRLLSNGQLDTSFGVMGRASVNFGTDHSTLNRTQASAASVTVLPGDRLIVAGNASVAEPGSYTSYGAAAELDAQGNLDTRFGDGGAWTVLSPDFAHDDRERVYFNGAARDGDTLYLAGWADSYNTAVSTEMDPDFAAVKLILPIFVDGFDGR